MYERNLFTRIWMYYILLVLLFLQANASDEPTYRRGAFPYSICKQTSHDVTCKKLNITKERQETASLWPPGPYAVRMKRHGCPEWYSRGWRKGVLILEKATFEMHSKLQFCTKTRHSPELDKGKWIPGMYTIHRVGELCPEGFAEHNITWTSQILNGTVSHFGHVPQFEAHNNSGFISILFYMCQRISNSSINESNFGMLETKFLLGKTENSDCPQFETTIVGPTLLDDETEQIYCSYYPYENSSAFMLLDYNSSCLSTDTDFSCLANYSSQLISDFHMSRGSFASSDLVMNFLVSEGILLESEINADEKGYVWYQFDMQRTLTVLEIAIDTEKQNNNSRLMNQRMYVFCFFDNVMWSFLHLDAAKCGSESTLVSPTLLVLHMRRIHARFITIVFEETLGYPTIELEGLIQIFIYRSDFPEVCNEDLGILDGSIQDLQITASSSLPASAARPLSGGWCAQNTDANPWILVDLLAVTVVEGVSVWGIDRGLRRATERDTGCSFFYLYYGNTIEDLSLYNEENFQIKTSRPATEVETVMLLNSVEARYVKLELQRCSRNDSGCLKFELHGCKLSGIPTFNCSSESEMFASETAILSEGRVEMENYSRKRQSCTNRCLKSENCSVAGYNDVDCFHYPSSLYGMWEITEKRNDENWSLKLCANDPIELFESMKSADGSVMTNVDIVEENVVITSIGYPFSYGSGQTYIWIIKFPEQRYIRIVFTNISLSLTHQGCNDRLLISKDIEAVNQGMEIDRNYNERAFVVETDKSILFLSFSSCAERRRVVERGFRAVITGEEIPACLSDTLSSTFLGSGGICNNFEMFLTSMSFLNYPFDNQEETWEIRAGEDHSILLHIINFYVVCQLDEGAESSRFTIVDGSERKSYCNTDLPSDAIYSKTWYLTVIFRKFKDPTKMFIRKEGFRLRYHKKGRNPLQKTEYSRKSTVKVCSETFGKCYYILHGRVTWDKAEETCWKCNLEIVSLTTRHELNFVHYLLRERRNADRELRLIDYDSTSYFAHIGFRRQLNRDGKRKFFWESGSPMTYSAWMGGYPRVGEDCTKTHLMLFSDESWVSELCTADIAQYFVCQSMDLEDENNENEDELCTCRHGWVQNSWDCYYFSDVRANWFDSSKYCWDHQSHLVEIEDALENKYLYSHLGKERRNYWMDLTKLYSYEEKFSWNTSGNPLIFDDILKDLRYMMWHGSMHCVFIHGWKHEWYLDFCWKRLNFICEEELGPIEDHCDAMVLKAMDINLTYTGNSCQNWSTLPPEAENDYRTRFPDFIDHDLDSDHCEDPSGSGIFWCYTTSGTPLWEPCFITMSSLEENYQNHDSRSNFQCRDGDEIPISNRCDGIFNCMDFSDEMYCNKKTQYLTNNNRRSGISYEIFEIGTNYLCGSEEWISILAKCDGIIDCLDASDETSCLATYTDLNQDNSSCNGSRCSFDVCDFSFDNVTADKHFNELRKCTAVEFTCENELCISMVKKCDGIPDCFDRSDESQCDLCKDSFHCDTVRCIPLSSKCDKYPDCEDGSDETSCVYPSPSSCYEVWAEGSTTSGQYYIDGLNIFCDFSSMFISDGKIKMYVRNIDVDIDMNQGYMYTRSETDSFIQLKERAFQDVVYREEYSCVLEVKSACHIRYAVTEFSGVFYKCHCIVETYNIAKEPYEQKYDVRNGSVSKPETIQLPESKYIRYDSVQCDGSSSTTDDSKYYNITSDGDVYIDDQVLKGVLPIEITLEVKCINDQGYNLSAEDNATITNGECSICIYYGDDTGLISKCGNGDRFENCADFTCPENTVKCPRSYCIPLSLVCNEKNDCPEGHDELECTCSNSAREVFILTEDSIDKTESNTAAINLAKQFYTIESDIRILYFTTQTPLQDFLNFEHRLLEIREKRVKPFKPENRIPDCLYKTMDRNFLSNIQFGSCDAKGIVFIEDTAESSKVAELLFSNLSKPAFTIYRVFKDSQFRLTRNESNTYSFVQDVRIKRWNELFSLGYRRFNRICNATTEVPCRGGYRCSSSKQCIPLEEVCDGIAQCIGKDDENFCDLFCPNNCTCVGYSINCRAGYIEYKDVSKMSINTRSADLSVNPKLRGVGINKKLLFPFMTRLNLSSCEITSVNENGFFYLNNIQCLDIGYNKIEMLPKNVFRHLRYLAYLNLDGSFKLRAISSTAFHGLDNLRSLRITGTILKRILANTFNGLFLQIIDISYNEIEEIEDYAFNNTSVDEIDFRGNNILTFYKHIFDGSVSLRRLRTSAFKFCCIRPCYVAERDCFPKRDEFSSCEDLMRHPVLQALLWLVGITALFGNLWSVIYRIVYDRDRLKIGYGIIVTNLAAADLLMGVYLITIAVADSHYRSRYIYVDEQWRNSNWCVAAGVISTVSSEASVLFVCLITLDRLLVIKYPFGTVKLTPTKAHFLCFVCWILAFTLAVIPVTYTSYFQNKFYSRSGVCVALPLTNDKPPGWVYSVSIFVGLNFCTFVLVAIGQSSIFLELRKTNRGMYKTQNSRKRDLRVARNLILIATTDFMCWFPIGFMGIMTLSGHPITGDVYAWTAVFILPFNSALNPVLYTLSAILGKESFNPSIEEQSRTEVRKEIGLGILQYKELLNSVRIKKGIREGKNVHDMIIDNDRISTTTVLATSMLLSRCLRLLQESSVSIDRLSPDTTYIKLNDKKRLKVSIVVDSKISIANDETKMQDDTYQFGVILRRLLTIRKPT